MTTFAKRGDAFENKFAHDETLRFKATARRNKQLALWAAEKLGRTDLYAYVREVIDEHQAAVGAHMKLISQFMFCLSAMNAVLLAGTAAIGIWLWAQGQIEAGVVATALPLAWQIANAAGWVSWEVSGIFENIGVVQEGMQTIAVPQEGLDRPGVAPLAVSRGEIRFEDVGFSYGREDGT